MRALLYGRYGRSPSTIEKLVVATGIEIVEREPEVVITFGGDGTLLGAERDYPGIAKLPLRDSQFCHICSPLPNEEVLQFLIKGHLELKEYPKLEAEAEETKLIALNDIVVRNKLPNSALRFEVAVRNSGKDYGYRDLIGDGVIVATAFGSTGYYRSITKESFEGGFGLAFNNMHTAEQGYPDSLSLGDDFEVKITVKRGPAELSADNDPRLTTLSDQTEIYVRKSKEKAKIFLA